MLIGKNAIITGANQGLGEVIAEEFVKQGANICICARNKIKLQEVVHKLSSMKVDSQIVRGYAVDISDNLEMHDFFSTAVKEMGTLDILVNNAGIYGPMGSIDAIEWNEWVKAVEINLLGTVFCMREAIGIFKMQEKRGKIVNLSGGGATAPMPNFSSYAATKSAIVRVTETFANECFKDGIDINAIAPGPLNTRLLDQVLESGRNVVGDIFFEKSLKQKENGGASLENAARLIAYLASEETNGITGKLISAVWDDWESLPEKKDLLRNSDIYTLRRIIPQDRGMNWDKE